MLLLWILLCVVDVSNGLYINRAFLSLDSWTHLAEFCFMRNGGSVEYEIRSDVPIPVVLYYSPGQEYLTQDNGLGTTETNQYSNTTISHTDGPMEVITNPSGNPGTTEDPNNEERRGLNIPCSKQNAHVFQYLSIIGKGHFNVVSDANDVMCLEFAIAPPCRQTLYNFKLELTITNDLAPFWWRHVSADDLFLFLADLTGLGFVIMLCIAAVCIRTHLISQRFYVHALNSCILSMLLLLLVFGVNILLHGLFSVDGYDVGNVRVIIQVIYISAQALFVQAIFLNAMKHTWCNDESKLERGYTVSLIISALVVFYGLSLVTIHVYRVFSEDDIISQYAQFGLQGFMWIVFVFMVLCTATSSPVPIKEDPSPRYLTNSLAKSGRLGPPQPPLRSLFGDYDYAINLPAVMEHQALQNATMISTSQGHDDEDDRATNYTDFDHVVTPTPPGEAAVRWVGVDVSGHYTDQGTAQPLGGCAVLMYSCWFLAVPLLSLWSPYLLPPWLTVQCLYALCHLNFLIGYIYFLASCVSCQEKTSVVPEQPETQTVQHISVL